MKIGKEAAYTTADGRPPGRDVPVEELAAFALSSGAFRLTPAAPVTWASGYRMPVYTDNRLLLRTSYGRDLVRRGLCARLASAAPEAHWDAVAGTASAGIAPALLVAEEIGSEFLYVRASAKDHGLARRIEGLTPDEANAPLPLAEKRVLLVEDLFSTGGSSAAAARALMEAGAEVPLCLANFSYGFSAVEETFAALPYACRPVAVFGLVDLLDRALAEGRLDADERGVIEDWVRDPFGWQDRYVPHGENG